MFTKELGYQSPSTSLTSLMKSIVTVCCGLLLLLAIPVATALPQGPNSRSSITADYRQVNIVAHVNVRKTERIEQIGDYQIYRVTSDILELFKGTFPRNNNFVYYMQVEAGYNMDHYPGEKIVFVSFHNNDEATEYRALENSDREPAVKVVKILRGLKRAQNQSSH